MGDISKLIADPAWWFSTVAIGLVVGVVATFAYAKLAKALAASSNWLGEKLKAREIERNAEAEFISSDGALLVSEGIRSLVVLVTWIALLLMSFSITIFQKFAVDSQMAENITGNILTDAFQPKGVGFKAFTFFLLFFVAFAEFLVFARFAQFSKARVKYKNRLRAKWVKSQKGPTL